MMYPGNMRPEKGLAYGYAPAWAFTATTALAKIWPQLADASPLKKEIVDKGIDFIIVRELIGGIYFGEHKTDEYTNGKARAVTDILSYTAKRRSRRIGRIGFETARKRNKKLCSVEKSNVLDSSRLWKSVMHRLAE